MECKVLFIADKENIETYCELLLKETTVGYFPFREKPDPFTYCDTDLIVLDCGLDAERGLDLLKEFKRCCPEILLVFLTAEGSERIAVEAFRAGAREYFRKPVNLFELQETVENLLSVKGHSRGKRSPLLRRDIYGKAKTFNSVTTEKPVNLLRAVRYMEENISQSITLRALADESNLSTCHFCREFSRHFGSTPMSYLTSIRVQRARELLMRNDMTVSSVAYELGYESPGTLIRNFKKHTGLTPSGYREHIRQENAEG